MSEQKQALREEDREEQRDELRDLDVSDDESQEVKGGADPVNGRPRL